MNQKEQQWRNLHQAIEHYAWIDPKRLTNIIQQQLPALLGGIYASSQLSVLIRQIIQQTTLSSLRPLRPLVKNLIVALCQTAGNDYSSINATINDLLVCFGYTQPHEERQQSTSKWSESEYADQFLKTPVLSPQIKLTLLTHCLISPIYHEDELLTLTRAIIKLPQSQQLNLSTLMAVMIGHNTDQHIDKTIINYFKNHFAFSTSPWLSNNLPRLLKPDLKTLLARTEMRQIWAAFPLHFNKALNILNHNRPRHEKITLSHHLLQCYAYLYPDNADSYITLASLLTRVYQSQKTTSYEQKSAFKALFTHNQTIKHFNLINKNLKLRHLVATQWTTCLAFQHLCETHADQLHHFTHLHPDILTKMVAEPTFAQAISQLIQSHPKAFEDVWQSNTAWTPKKRFLDARLQVLALLLKYDEKKFTLACAHPELTQTFRGLNYLLLFSEGFIRLFLLPDVTQYPLGQTIIQDPNHPLPNPVNFKASLINLDSIHKDARTASFDSGLNSRILLQTYHLMTSGTVARNLSKPQIYLQRRIVDYQNRNTIWERLISNPEIAQHMRAYQLLKYNRLIEHPMLKETPRLYTKWFQHLSPKKGAKLLFDILLKDTHPNLNKLFWSKTLNPLLKCAQFPVGFNIIKFIQTDFFRAIIKADEDLLTKFLPALSWIFARISYGDLIALSATNHHLTSPFIPLRFLCALPKFFLLDLYTETRFNAKILLDLLKKQPAIVGLAPQTKILSLSTIATFPLSKWFATTYNKLRLEALVLATKDKTLLHFLALEALPSENFYMAISTLKNESIQSQSTYDIVQNLTNCEALYKIILAHHKSLYHAIKHGLLSDHLTKWIHPADPKPIPQKKPKVATLPVARMRPMTSNEMQQLLVTEPRAEKRQKQGYAELLQALHTLAEEPRAEEPEAEKRQKQGYTELLQSMHTDEAVTPAAAPSSALDLTQDDTEESRPKRKKSAANKAPTPPIEPAQPNPQTAHQDITMLHPFRHNWLQPSVEPREFGDILYNNLVHNKEPSDPELNAMTQRPRNFDI